MTDSPLSEAASGCLTNMNLSSSSPSYNTLGNIGATPFHHFRQVDGAKQQISTSTLISTSREENYDMDEAPDLVPAMEEDEEYEFECEEEYECHEDEEKHDPTNIYLNRVSHSNPTVKTSSWKERMYPDQVLLRNLVFTSQTSLRSYCSHVQSLLSRHKNRSTVPTTKKRRKKQTSDQISFISDGNMTFMMRSIIQHPVLCSSCHRIWIIPFSMDHDLPGNEDPEDEEEPEEEVMHLPQKKSNSNEEMNPTQSRCSAFVCSCHSLVYARTDPDGNFGSSKHMESLQGSTHNDLIHASSSLPYLWNTLSRKNVWISISLDLSQHVLHFYYHVHKAGFSITFTSIQQLFAFLIHLLVSFMDEFRSFVKWIFLDIPHHVFISHSSLVDRLVFFPNIYRKNPFSPNFAWTNSSHTHCHSHGTKMNTCEQHERTRSTISYSSTTSIPATTITAITNHGGFNGGIGGSSLLLSAGVVSAAGREALSRVNTFLGLGSSNTFFAGRDIPVTTSSTSSSAVTTTTFQHQNEKMIHKMNKIDSAARVISYFEKDNDVLPIELKQRVQRMMHYQVPLRPFVATVCVANDRRDSSRKMKRQTLLDNTDLENINFSSQRIAYKNHLCSKDVLEENVSISSSSSSLSTLNGLNSSNSPFMCTPKSFPPTPSSRAHVLARGSRFSDDVVFLARDLLRLEQGLGSDNSQTRAMAKALRDERRLAVFNSSDASSGIFLTRGRHCASKIGNDLYASVRGMIPILRNCHVYFEMTISAPSSTDMNAIFLHHASLSIGLSTLEMPLNALVGAWKGSIGLCSTSQILVASQWCSPLHPLPYGVSSTVGCLIQIDDQSSLETWDGLMVSANVIFNVNGHIVIPTTGRHIVPPSNLSISCVSSQCHEALKYRYHDNYFEFQPSPMILMLVPRGEDLYPTLTLHSTDTDVTCRFSSADILAKSREEIGAPDGLLIYGVDGSILFHDDSTLRDISSSEPNSEP